MRGNFYERYNEEEAAPPSERATGVVFACFSALIGAFAYGNIAISATAWIVAVAFALLSWLAPQTLGPLNRAWFSFSLALNRIVSPIVMLAVYLVAIVPIGLAMQLVRDPLRAKRAGARSSYWIARDDEDHKSSMTNQF